MARSRLVFERGKFSGLEWDGLKLDGSHLLRWVQGLFCLGQSKGSNTIRVAGLLPFLAASGAFDRSIKFAACFQKLSGEGWLPGFLPWGMSAQVLQANGAQPPAFRISKGLSPQNLEEHWRRVHLGSDFGPEVGVRLWQKFRSAWKTDRTKAASCSYGSRRKMTASLIGPK